MVSDTTTIEVRRKVHKQVKVLAANLGVNIKTLYDEMLTKFSPLYGVWMGVPLRQIPKVFGAKVVTYLQTDDDFERALFLFDISSNYIATVVPALKPELDRIRRVLNTQKEVKGTP